MRTLADLVNPNEPGLDLVKAWLDTARPGAELLACEPTAGERTLLALQVTTRSPLGALAFATGGLLVDNGWVRVLGAGCPRLPRDLAAWNTLPGASTRIPGALLVADDAVGGFFALNGGAFGPGGATVFYLAPDNLEWEDTGKAIPTG